MSLAVPPLPLLPPGALIGVERALGELRRGWPVVVDVAGTQNSGGQSIVVLAAEAGGERSNWFAWMTAHAEGVAVTGRRALVLGLSAIEDGPALLVRPTEQLTAAWLRGVVNPLAETPTGIEIAGSPPWAATALTLVKLARLLPAAVVATGAAIPEGLLRVSAREIEDYPVNAARALRKVAEAQVPLADAEETRLVAFRPDDGGLEHIALIIGHPDPAQPVLTRLHSECFTGDLLGSLKCDCGDQLRGAIAAIARAGSGVLLYLAQEGRGIGLVNKLRAYDLQAAGFDTLDANGQLGFDADERLYLPAVEMLRLLGIGRVRLMTNNPAKVDGLTRSGIEVVERVPHIFPATAHNAHYLHTKAVRSGHLF